MTFLLSEKYPELRSLPMENGSNLGQKVSPGSEGVVAPVAAMPAVSAEVPCASAAAHSPNFSITMHHLFKSFQRLFLFSSFPHQPHIFISKDMIFCCLPATIYTCRHSFPMRKLSGDYFCHAINFILRPLFFQLHFKRWMECFYSSSRPSHICIKRDSIDIF